MNSSPEPMEVVHTAYGLPEAELIRSLLEAAGLKVLMTPSGAGVAYGFTVGPLARTEIYVPGESATQARAIIATLDETPPDVTEAPAPTTPAD